MKLSDKDYIGSGGTCAVCGDCVSKYTANTDLVRVRPEASDWDWWWACDNESCTNHNGEGVFQKTPKWCLR